MVFAGFRCIGVNYIGSWDLTQEAFLSVLVNDIFRSRWLNFDWFERSFVGVAQFCIV